MITDYNYPRSGAIIMHVVSYHQCQRPYFFFQSFSVTFKWTSVNIEQGVLKYKPLKLES